ncbi:MAG: hypothetical protein JSW51_13555 [Gemmatimonadota bacterium]|nr:MAG: hypothetical protein JSW51_13555 [Gemmatimonadota bacterium]
MMRSPTQRRMHADAMTVMVLLLSSLPFHVVSSQADISTAVANLKYREIGPAVMGGRISDLAVVESKPQIFYVGTASGGVWKTTNHGTTWEPIFDDQSTASIGDVTLAPSNPNVIWVGTGEPQNRQSSPWGNGVYRSTDAGRTWHHLGLENTHHIGRIVVHPDDPHVAYVAAVGHLWGPNPERGVYRTRDGGGNWELVLFIDEHTGAIDLAMDPGDPNTLFAAMYQRQRTGWGFNGGGPGSGIYRSTDGGDTWKELTAGLPEGDMGRIGLDIYRGDGNLVLAVVEADARDPSRGFGSQGQSGERKTGVYRSTDRGETWEKISDTNPRPMYYSQIRIDPTDPERVYVLGTQLMISDDGGKTFRSDGADAIHVDHHALWIDPNDPDHLIIGNDGGVSASFDRSVHWRMYDNLAIGQFYQIGVDMRDPYYVCGGLQDNSSWCGPNRTLNAYGIRNSDWIDIWGGDGFFNLIDPTDHTIVYTESQGGNLGRVDLTTGEGARIRPVARPLPNQEEEEDRSFRFNWNAPIVISAHDPATILFGGNVLFKSRDRGVTWEEISPDLTKQIDRKELEIMGVPGSEPMMSANDGISTYGNITTIGESPLNGDVIYVGTDDGNVQLTQDGGATWTDLTSRIRDLPERTYVSRLVPSRFVEGRVYATFDGHRNNDFAPYVYVSEDFGQRWQAIGNGLPHGWSVNVIAEHPDNEALLVLGNEVGVFLTIDRGAEWTQLKNNLPTVPVDDIVIHPRDNDLVVGTHGRSIWILGDITPLAQLTPELLASPAHLFPVQPATMYALAGGWPFWHTVFTAPNPPVGANIRYFLRDKLTEESAPVAEESSSVGSGPSEQGQNRQRPTRGGDDVKAIVVILGSDGDTVRVLEASGEPGIHEITWDLRIEPPFESQGGQGGFFGAPRGPRVLPGTYSAQLEVAGQSHSQQFEVRGDPRIEISAADRMARQDALMSVYELNKSINQANRAVNRLNGQVSDIQVLIKEHEDAPESLLEDANALSEAIGELRQELSQANRDARVANSIEGSTSRPTADQLWQIDRAWDKVPALIEQINEIVTTSLPTLYRACDEHGIRPDPGQPIELPRKPGG